MQTINKIFKVILQNGTLVKVFQILHISFANQIEKTVNFLLPARHAVTAVAFEYSSTLKELLHIIMSVTHIYLFLSTMNASVRTRTPVTCSLSMVMTAQFRTISIYRANLRSRCGRKGRRLIFQRSAKALAPRTWYQNSTVT